MRNPNDDPQIRPIPIEDEDEIFGHRGVEKPRAREQRQPRPWMPLAAAAGAVTLLLGLVTIAGISQTENGASSPSALEGSATTTEAPRTLEETLPGNNGRLALVTTDGEALWTLTWDPSFSVPLGSAMMRPDVDAWTSASFDASGEFVAAIAGTTPAGSPGDVWIVEPNGISHVRSITGVLSLAWHSAEPRKFAFVQQDEGGDGEAPSYVLRLAEVGMHGGPVDTINTLIRSQDPFEVVRWDDDEIIIAEQGTTTILNQIGKQTWAFDAKPRIATPESLIVLTLERDQMQWSIVDRSTREQVFAPLPMETGRSGVWTGFAASASRDLLAEVTTAKDETSVRILGTESRSGDVTTVRGKYGSSAFTADDRYIVLWDPRAADMVFIELQTGEAYRFRVPVGHQILAVDLAAG